MTDAFEKWLETQPVVHDVEQARAAWDAALEWARSGQEPKCWMQESVDVESRCYNLFLTKEEVHEDVTAEAIPLYTHPATADVTELVEALNVAYDYVRDFLFEFDQKYGGHPAMERQKNSIAEDLKTVKKALAKWEGRK